MVLFGLNRAPQFFYSIGAHGDRLFSPSGDLGDTISGRLVDTISGRLVNSTPKRQVLLRHQAQLIDTLDLVGFILNRKKSELDLTQDLQFLRIRLRLDLGEASLPESKAWEIVAHARHLSSLRVLIYSQVSQLMGSLNWASGLIPLGRLYLRPLQFSLIRSDKWVYATASIRPTVLANLLRQWQDLCFLTSGIPIRTFQADFTIFTDASTQGWGAHMGDSQISGTWTRTDRKLHIICLELKAVASALKHWVPMLQGLQLIIAMDNSTVVFVYQQTRWDPFPHLVTFDSRASPLVRGSEHNSPSQASRLSERDSRPPISSESANIDKVVPPPEIMKRIFRLWGTPEVDMFATVLNSHLPWFMSPIPEPRALAVDALSQD